jgi:hypothetical protein
VIFLFQTYRLKSPTGSEGGAIDDEDIIDNRRKLLNAMKSRYEAVMV